MGMFRLLLQPVRPSCTCVSQKQVVLTCLQAFLQAQGSCMRAIQPGMHEYACLNAYPYNLGMFTVAVMESKYAL